MEILLKETINFAEIRPYLNYCPMDVNGRFDKTSIDFFDIPTKSANTNYYYAPKPQGKRERKIPFIKSHQRKLKDLEIDFLGHTTTTQDRWTSTFYTEDDEVIKKYYADPFSIVSIKTITLTLFRDGDNISVKFHKKHRSRGFNKKFFKITNTIFGIKFNTKNGNITSYNTSFKKSLKNKHFTVRVNWFQHIAQVLYQFSNLKHSFYGANELKEIVDKTDHECKIYHDITERLSPDKFITSFLNEVDLSDCEGLDRPNLTHEILSKLIQKMVKIKNIKTPNDWFDFMFVNYPGSKYLKKNDNKLVLAVLDSYGIKTKSLVRIIHKYPTLSLYQLSELAKLFGSKYPSYLGNIKDEVYKEWSLGQTKNPLSMSQTPMEIRKSKRGVFDKFQITDAERENIFKLINDTSKLKNNVINLFLDHLSMIHDCRAYYPDLSFTSNNWRSFDEEHMRLSRIVKKIKSGMTVEYVYDNRLIRDIETRIEDIKPYILKTDEEYSEEGDFMHHCVATYSTKDQSIIVSLRDINGKDRVTCEFNKKNGSMVQARYFSNQQPPENFENSIEVVRRKILKHSKSGLTSHLDMRKIPIKINGIEVVPKRQIGVVDLEHDDPFDLHF